MISGKLFGVKEMRATLKKIADNFPDRVAAAIYREAQIEMTEAKRRTPVDITPHAPHPGQLRASGTVHEPERDGRNISVTLSFGGAAKDYAVFVHENPDAFHPVGQWKYLESVLNESRSSMAARLARRVDLNRMKA
jgi:hypothetical protein